MCSLVVRGPTTEEGRVGELIQLQKGGATTSSNHDLQHALGQFVVECEVAKMRTSQMEWEQFLPQAKKFTCERELSRMGKPLIC